MLYDLVKGFFEAIGFIISSILSAPTWLVIVIIIVAVIIGGLVKLFN